MNLAQFSVLSDQEIKAIHEASVDILADCGVKVLNRRMIERLKSKGLQVDAGTQTVLFSRSALEDALAMAPPQFDVYDRRGEYAFTLGDGRPKIAAGHNAVFWVDSGTGERRPSTVADVELNARICQELESIHMIGIPVMPQDVPDPKATLLYGVRAVIENSTKPVFFSCESAKVNRYCIRLLEAAFEGDFTTQAYGISQLSPTSPLFWQESVLDAIMDTIDTAVPLAILPEPNAGVSAPYTLAGLLTVNNAECLSGLAMIQLLSPGSRVLYANSWTTTDMRNGASLVGSTETTICRIAGAQLARFYNVPSHTTAPNSDNHAHDEQNAWEKAYSIFAAVGAGNDLIVNCGMFASGLTYSNEQLLMDEEMAAMALRMARGIEVSDQTIAKDLIQEIGPQGETYLCAEHTLSWLRKGEHLDPRLSVRDPFAVWESQGAKHTDRIARDKVKAYGDLPPATLPEQVKARLRDIVASFSA